MSKHAPGPWGITHTALMGFRVSDSTGWGVALVLKDTNDDANARLIAAAPQMLEALEMVAEWNGDPDKYLNLDDVRSAIKATKGGSMTTGTKCCEHHKDGLPYCVECEKESDQRREELHAKLAETEQAGETLESKLAGAEIQLEQARAEIERKDKLIEQMKNCYNCKFELHAAKECETCNTADCDDSYLYETSNWQPKEPEAAERGR
ncbi:hypothetical protein MASR1M12_42040 [Erysipelotrichia bacterium]